MSGGHSPGPWEAKRDRTIHDGHGTPLLRCYADRNEEANARLIAASPDLLSALVRLMPTNIDLNNPNISDDLVVPCDVTIGELRQARAAISKALTPTLEKE